MPSGPFIERHAGGHCVSSCIFVCVTYTLCERSKLVLYVVRVSQWRLLKLSPCDLLASIALLITLYVLPNYIIEFDLPFSNIILCRLFVLSGQECISRVRSVTSLEKEFVSLSLTIFVSLL